MQTILKKSLFLILCNLFVSNVASAQNHIGEKNMPAPKILIAYYSVSGNTETIAKYIQEASGGDLFKIETINPYPADYRATTEQAKKEIEEGYLPPLKTQLDNLSDYEVIFIGSPCWWGTIAPAVSSFLKQNDLSGKTIIPFSTHGGSGLANNAKAIGKLAPNATLLEGRAFWGKDATSAQQDVKDWLTELKF